jgi:hypothetical protein
MAHPNFNHFKNNLSQEKEKHASGEERRKGKRESLIKERKKIEKAPLQKKKKKNSLPKSAGAEK